MTCNPTANAFLENSQEFLMSIPFQNPYRYLLIFDDFNTMPQVVLAASAISGWGLAGAGATLVNTGLGVLGTQDVPSAMDIRTGSAANNVSILFPSSRISTFAPWTTRICNNQNEWFLAWRGGAIFGNPANQIIQLGFSSAGIPSTLDTTPSGPCFQTVAGETVKFVWGSGTANTVSLDTGVTLTSGEFVNDFLAHYKDGHVRVFADGVLRKTALFWPSGNVTTSDLAPSIAIQTTVASSMGFSVDYFMFAIQRVPYQIS